MIDAHQSDGKCECDTDQAFLALKLLTTHAVFELCAIGKRGAKSRYCPPRSGRLAVDIAKQNSGKANVYIRLNPLAAETLDRSRDGYSRKAAKDVDVTQRRWLFIDCDSIRLGAAATDEQHAAAIDLAKQVRSELAAAGWPLPILSDSGNGAHLLYRIDLPNDDDSKDLLKRFLAKLSATWTNDVARVDPTMFNAARLCRLPGTLNLKAGRLSRFINVPEQIELVTREQIEAITGPAPERPKPLSVRSDFVPDADPQRVAGRAWAYIDKLPRAVEGQPGGGGKATIHCARVLYWDFALDQHESAPLFERWCSECDPPWEEHGSQGWRRKLDEAEKFTSDRPRGWRLTEDREQTRAKRKGDPLDGIDTALTTIEWEGESQPVEEWETRHRRYLQRVLDRAGDRPEPSRPSTIEPRSYGSPALWARLAVNGRCPTPLRYLGESRKQPGKLMHREHRCGKADCPHCHRHYQREWAEALLRDSEREQAAIMRGSGKTWFHAIVADRDRENTLRWIRRHKGRSVAIRLANGSTSILATVQFDELAERVTDPDTAADIVLHAVLGVTSMLRGIYRKAITTSREWAKARLENDHEFRKVAVPGRQAASTAEVHQAMREDGAKLTTTREGYEVATIEVASAEMYAAELCERIGYVPIRLVSEIDIELEFS